MKLILKTAEFDRWFRKLTYLRAKAKILLRIQRLETAGHYGDCKALGDGLMELRIHEGKGYRVYFKEEGNTIVILLLGGNKSTQQKDIEKARALWEKRNE